ncbi:hypothetical protein [Pseudoduganella sp. OTU4001]|uniref:hypothetical protein n=1 Tax=Pseudoduganella sp. OTU4001 TaxID=3043854 RepID=UPI00313D19A9
MTQAWVVLSRPDRRDVSAPTEDQLAAALADVYGGNGSATLKFGYDDGLMYQVEVGQDGALRYEEWSDRDCEIALATPRHMSCKQEVALQIWKWLAQRQVAKIRSQAWASGD